MSILSRWVSWIGSLILLILIVYLFYTGKSEPISGLFGLLGVMIGTAIANEAQIRNSDLDRKHQLGMAALDRRLEVHQEAFALWRKVYSTVYDQENLGNTIIECEEWWNKNCLYLMPEARFAFRTAYYNASVHAYFLKSPEKLELIKRNWTGIEDAGAIIAAAASLPSLGKLETIDFVKR